MADYSTLTFESEAAWENWLEENHTSADGLWLKIAKKASGYASVTYPEALTVALCFGWIDGQKKSFDDDYWLQKFTPRRKRSNWSKINRGKAEALIKQGRMRAAGMREIEQAQADGRWDAAYESQGTIEVPEEFQKELDKNPKAQEFFNRLNRANRYAILYRIVSGKKPETRQRNIDKFIKMLNKGKKIYD